MAFADLKRSAQHDVGLITAALTGTAVALSWLPLVAEIPLMVPIVFLGLVPIAVVLIALLLWGLRGAADRRAAAEPRPTAGHLSGWAHRVDR